MLSTLWLGFKNSAFARAVVAALAGAAALLIIIATAFKKGAADEKGKNTQDVLEAVKRKVSSDEEVARDSAAERRSKLMRWTRN
jgi:FixJ family two-component response regulator